MKGNIIFIGIERTTLEGTVSKLTGFSCFFIGMGKLPDLDSLF